AASDVTVDTQAKVIQQSLATAATYQVGVKVMDVFGQLSAETLSSATGLDLTISTLRADIIYSDVLGTSPTSLKAALADDVVGSGGISYTSSASWRYITAERALLDRYRYLTVAMWQTSGSTTWYLRTSADAVTWRYFTGPVTSSRILTEVADQTAARAAPVALATLGNSTSNRVELPSTVEARYLELWFLNSTGTTRVDEFYPRRLVQADDIQAQNLSAISGNLGTITAGTITSVTITGSTITGGTVQTAASGARVELTSAGLKTYDSGGTVVIEATTATNGALTAGAGAIKVDNTGIDIRDSLVSPIQFFDDATNDEIGRISGSGSTGSFSIFGRTGVQLELGTNNGSLHTLTFGTMSGGTATATFSESVKITKGLNIGSATGAGTGEIRASASITAGGTASAAVRLLTYGSGTTAGAYAFNAKDGAGTNLMYIENNGNVYVSGNTGIGGAVSAVTKLITYGTTSAAGNYAFNAKNSSGTNLMYLENNGTAFVNSAWTVSDASEKRNIRALVAADFARARAIPFARYMRNLGDIDEIGVIAQDVQAVAPEFVRAGMDGVLAVNMIALLCAKVAALEAQIAGGKA
ncbi:MAG TPA: tail fiber domain-containing protein, partial [Roseiflexaceae bacterium]|nr:tail fiber domain-containing protein [Roseiflexaceae bacterium]